MATTRKLYGHHVDRLLITTKNMKNHAMHQALCKMNTPTSTSFLETSGMQNCLIH
uniref:Uncharacterized protein n=1 Tax=Rhizophora mucronata TaxID=61149 RepID=A0A2P2PNN0_RHIMU